MLEDYFLLVRRIPGISLSVSDFWELDTWTTAKLLSLEKEIIKEEEKQFKEANNEYVEQPDSNSPEMNSIVNRMSKVAD